MKHATDLCLDRLEPYLRQIRRLNLLEKKRGVFYRRGQAFLHFHEHGALMFADIKIDGAWQRLPVDTLEQQASLFDEAVRALGRDS